MSSLFSDLEMIGDVSQSSSQVDSHANHSLSQAREKARRILATSGRRCVGSFGRLSRNGSWAKMFSELLIGTGDWYSSRCNLTWRVRGTKYNRMFFLLQVSERLTNDNERGLLPTPSVADTEGAPKRPETISQNSSGGWQRVSDSTGTKFGAKLNNVAGLLPTPSVMDIRTDIRSEGDYSDKAKKGGCSNLREKIVGMLPTPTAQDGDKAVKRMRDDHQNGLTAVVFDKLLPTPVSNDSKNKENSPSEGERASLSRAFYNGLLPTPKAVMPTEAEDSEIVGNRVVMESGQDFSVNLETLATRGLLPTPNACECKQANTVDDYDVKRGYLRGYAVEGLLPTPTAIQRDHPERVSNLKEKGAVNLYSRVNGSARPNSILDHLQFYASEELQSELDGGLLPTPRANKVNDCNLSSEGVANRGKHNLEESVSKMVVTGILPTPRANDCMHSKPGQKSYDHRLKRGYMAEVVTEMAINGMYPNPTAADGGKLGGREGQDSLTRIARDITELSNAGLLPTPVAGEYRDTGEGVKGNNYKQQNLTRTIANNTDEWKGTTTQLNPQFVAEMMGFPPDWCIAPFLDPEEFDPELMREEMLNAPVSDFTFFPTQSPVLGKDNILVDLIKGISFPKHRNESIKAYGNAICPQVYLQIAKTIELYQNQQYGNH
jgi:hypothetical protein